MLILYHNLQAGKGKDWIVQNKSAAAQSSRMWSGHRRARGKAVVAVVVAVVVVVVAGLDNSNKSAAAQSSRLWSGYLYLLW